MKKVGWNLNDSFVKDSRFKIQFSTLLQAYCCKQDDNQYIVLLSQ